MLEPKKLVLPPEAVQHCSLTEQGEVEAGNYVYVQGASATSFYYIRSGIVGLYHLLDSGKESLLRLYKTGEYFGYRTIFSRDQTYHCSAKILKSATLVNLRPTVPVEEFLDANPQLTQQLMFNLSKELQDAENRLSKQAYTKSLDRVFESIHYLCTNYPDYKWTYREIAEYAGCETETAIRISKELRKTGLLDQFRSSNSK